MDEKVGIIEKIIDGGFIKPVYQPIVSLKDGEILGYEALSRISKPELQINIESMFQIAGKMGKLWELEKLCRTKALERSVDKPDHKKLFLNVNPRIIHDEKLKNGFTKKFLQEYCINADDIIFEITEREAVSETDIFFKAINHYKNQHYNIAIDDVGAGFSGLNMIVDVQPDYLKLDMNLIRDIDKDEIKISLCKAFVEFGKNTDISLIAEGIETEEELKTLIKLGVQYGQGFFLGIPQESFEQITPEVIQLICYYYSKQFIENAKSSVYPIIEHLCKQGHTFSPGTKATDVYELMKANNTVTEICIIENEEIIGFLTRALLNEFLGGRYGFSLHAKRTVRELMKTDFFKVPYNMPVDKVSRIAMQRQFEQLYDPVVVEKDGKFRGLVTVKDLLDDCTKIQIDVAIHSNPLTGLPGNLMLEQEIKSRILGREPFCITYYDLDDFKGYNDAYGFANGDLMLRLVADILKRRAAKDEFIGHIGGDDFIVIADYFDGKHFCESVLEDFTREVVSLYRDEDIKNGYIISKNRHGVTENFPIASLSIAGITNQKKTYNNIDDFSRDEAKLKKICKQHTGNYYEIW